jgi:proline dehydrogenase
MNSNKLDSISFDNTATAFEYKSDKALKKAHFLFSIMGKPLMVKLGVTLIPLAVKMKIPFVKSAIRNTIFSQFVGGEDLAKTATVANNLKKFEVQVILDYGVEGAEDESAFEAATAEFIKVIEYASKQPNIPFISIKITGIARFGLLELLDNNMRNSHENTFMKRYYKAVEELSDLEKNEWHLCVSRLLKICDTANKMNIGVLVDAEESWIQDPVDTLTILMMDSFNKTKAVVFNTIQLYRHDRLEFLKLSHVAASERNFILGVKLVRGAYMEKERLRAINLVYHSPIQKDKAASDHDYDLALHYCIDNIDNISFIVASHNEKSNLLVTELMQQKVIDTNHHHVHFSQLYGMSDNITFNLAKHGFNVSKYLPFGPIKDVVPYLMRRARENSSVAGQTGRELGLIKRELERRGGERNRE